MNTDLDQTKNLSHSALVNSEKLIECLKYARVQSWKVLNEIRDAIQEGMTEKEAHDLALIMFQAHGVKKHWHKPYIRFGKGTTLTFHEPFQPEYRLKSGDPFFIDLGPVWSISVSDRDGDIEVEGDVGASFVLGENSEAQRCISAVKALFQAGQKKWLKSAMTGRQIYLELQKIAEEGGYSLLKEMDGHMLSEFPHSQKTKQRFATLDVKPSNCSWILELQIVDQKLGIGAFYEDLLFI